MSETEKVRLMGYNLKGEKWDTTITGIYDRASTDIKVRLSTLDTLRYNYIFLKRKYKKDSIVSVKKVRLSLVSEGIFHDMVILLEGTAYVMNGNGDTVDTIKSIV